jgi:dGTPase
VAASVARATRLNVALTTAAALGHDCGHGPAGHASEVALTPFLPGGYHHAVFGADVVLAPLNLCVETLDAVRNHSWNRPAPSTPEGEVVAWADRVAYVCHDLEDAVAAGIIDPSELPADATAIVGHARHDQLHAFIGALVDTIHDTGAVGLRDAEAGALDALRAFCYERIYLRPAAVDQAERVVRLLRELTELCIEQPSSVGLAITEGGDPTVDAVRYVSGMTDRFALRLAVEHLGWRRDALPMGV